MLYIKAANYADIEKEWLFVKEMPTDENGLTNEWSGCSRKTFEKEALPQMIAYSEGRNPYASLLNNISVRNVFKSVRPS